MQGFESSDTSSIVSVTERVQPVALPRPAIAIHWLGEAIVFVASEESVFLAAGADDSISEVALHAGAVLCSAGDGRRVVTGGDDGKLVTIDGAGRTETLATDSKRRWIDNVALHIDGVVAWSAGKTANVRSLKGEIKSFDAPSTVGGLAFAPKGLRLAIAHYNGVTLWFPNMAAKPDVLEWKGSHLGVVFSADNRFVVTTMHEAAMHGWRLADNKHMRMTGYPARVRSVSWSAGGKALATSGADSVIVWPFAAKDGPMGKEPDMLAPLKSKVSAVACHPKQEIIAAGYGDGTILLVRQHDGAEILVRRNAGGAVAAVAWNSSGTRLAFATEDGDAGVLTL